MTLTNTACLNAKPKEKPYKMADSGGLYLEVAASGSKYWRWKYRFAKREKRLALGVYPAVTLQQAREGRDAARKTLAEGKDPSIVKQATRRHGQTEVGPTFKALALEWHEIQLEGWSPKHAQNIKRRLEADLFPHIGGRPANGILPRELLEVIRKIEKRGALDISRRVKQLASQVFRYGVACGSVDRDPAADLKDALKVYKAGHYAALEIEEMPPFIQAIVKNDARLFARTRRAMKLMMLTFVRTTELTEAHRTEFDLDAMEWRIPGERMKKEKPHIVPLSRQAVQILREQLDEINHLNTPYMFPSQISLEDPMSNNTILAAIRRLGYKGRMTGHGFRAVAMTAIKEKLGYRHEVVDRQLAHTHRNKVDAAYDRAKFLDERKTMMQEWADYLDVIASNGKIVHVKFKKQA